MSTYKSSRKQPWDMDRYERARFVAMMFYKHEDYYEPELRRLIRNQRMMWGVNFAQWPAYVVERLRMQGRRPPTFNIIGKKIQTQIGSFMANGFDIRYTPTTGRIDQLTNSVNDMRFSDEHNLDWKVSERIALRDCFTMVGYERMYISDQFSELGNIAWEPLNPAHVFLDTGWKSGFVNDIRHYFEYGMFLASELAEMFPDQADKLKELKSREEFDGVDLGEFHGGVTGYRDTESKWGSRHKLITFHHVTKEERFWEYDLKHRCNFPETGFDAGSEMDREAKIQYIQMMGLDPNHDVTIRKQIRRVKRVESICPTIDAELFLTAGKDKIQTNNCNIYPIGDQYNGQFKGTCDELYDVQLSYNKGRMNVDDIIMRSAKGAFVLDEALANGNAEKMRQIESEWNNPAARIWVEEGSTVDLGPNGGIIELPAGNVSPESFRQSAELFDLADSLSMVPAAMDARTESSGESGKLYQSKVQVGLIGQKYGMEIYEAHKKDKAAAYIIQSKITYAGWPRTFVKPGSEEPIEINRRMTDGFGNRYIVDDISKLPDMLVSLIPSRQGINMRTELRSQYAESLPLLADPADRLARLVILSSLYKTYELPEVEKQEVDMAFQMLKQNAALQETMNHLQLKGAVQQAMAGPAGPQMTAGGGAPQLPHQVTAGEPSAAEMNQGTPQEGVVPGEEFTAIPGGP